MRILITGGTGFIGSAFIKQHSTYQFVVLSRNPTRARSLLPYPQVERCITSLAELDEHQHFDAVINLAGEGIADKRWSAARKQLLCDSRWQLTEQLVNWLSRVPHKPQVLLSGSAVGFYGDCGSTQVTEESPAHDEFSHQLCQRWEALALAAQQYGIRVCCLRTGLVLGRGKGLLGKLELPFKLGLGGQLGDGQHYMPWIHLQDMLRAIDFLLQQPLSGAINMTAPQPVTNAHFSHALADSLERPMLFNQPALVVKALFGELAQLLLSGQNAYPQKLKQAGFEFTFNNLELALLDIYHQS